MDTGHEHKDYSYLNDRWERERKDRIKELEKENKELKQRLEAGQHETIVISCDVCGCHPSVYICTEKGTFCQEHAKF